MNVNPVSIITGAATGIGFTLAQKLLEQGHALVLNDIDKDALHECAARLNESSAPANGNISDLMELVIGDAGSLDVIDLMVKAAIDRFGRIDNAIANAGITTFGQFLDYTPKQLEQLLSVNIQGSFFLAQRVAQAIIASNGNVNVTEKQQGRILLMSSVTGIQYHPDLAAYGMTKAALKMLARNLGAELASHGITVNCIAPGATATERTETDPEYTRTWAELTPTGRASTTNDIAAAACFLLSKDAAQITGQTIVVDGGWTLLSPT